jgi:DNA-binding NarL/FixJ family response regulator
VSIRVLLVDDQRVIRDGLGMLLRLLPDIELVGSAEDGQQAIDLVAREEPDVVLMDLRMPRMDGIRATQRIRQAHPTVKILALTTYADDESVLGALRAGASGYLTKDAGADDIAQAVATVASGQMVLDPAAQARVLQQLHASAATSEHRSTASAIADNLTQREVEILVLIAQGLSNSEIAERLVVSEATVKTHINHIFTKTGVRDRAQAVTYAFRSGLVAM